MLNRFHLLAAVVLWLGVIPSWAQEVDYPTYATTKDAAEAILGPLSANDFDRFGEVLKQLFNESGARTLSNAAKSFLTEGEFFDYQDMIHQEKLGDSFVRELYVLRSNKNDFLFVEFFIARTGDGWRVHNFTFNSDLSEFIPYWVDP